MGAMRHLRVYTNLICFNAYLYEYYHAMRHNEIKQANHYKLLSFDEWMHARGELKLWLDKMQKNPQLALSMNRIEFDNENEEEKGLRAVFDERSTHSNVLSGNAMLKVDYFPGCAQLHTQINCESAINFRFIHGMAGLAVPTTQAMQEVVQFVAKQQAKNTKSSKVLP